MRLNTTAVEDFMAMDPPGISQSDLARLTKLSKSYICELLKGDKPGTPKTWHKIANALGVRFASIVSADEEVAA